MLAVVLTLVLACMGAVPMTLALYPSALTDPKENR